MAIKQTSKENYSGMKDKDIGIEMQYEILHERTWNYNGLLWKNFLAYGAALFGIAHMLSSDFGKTFPGSVFMIGGLILFLLGFIQWALVNGLKRTVESAQNMESKFNLVEITNKQPMGLGIKWTYRVAALMMMFLGLVGSGIGICKF